MRSRNIVMTDPLDFWYGNTEVMERLTDFLSLRDVGRLCQVSRRWREALEVDHVWWRLAGRLEGCREMFGSLSPRREDGGHLGPRCAWAQHLALSRGLRRRWRTGGEVRLTPPLPDTPRPSGDRITCYDCDGELLVLGTEKSLLVTYNMASNTETEQCRAVLSVRVDKVYTRHTLVIAMQAGLVQVLTSSLQIIYCKSLELPDLHTDLNMEDEFFVPPLSVGELRRTYRPCRPMTLSQYDLTVSTTGRPHMWIAKTGDTKAACYGLQSGELEQTLRLEEGDTMFKLGLVQLAQYSSYLYLLLYDEHHRTVGTMYNTKHQTFLWRIELTNVFSYQHNVFSVYTTKGLLMFGRLQGDTDYPFTWAWRGWKYDGEEFYRSHFETEFDMSLTDWTSEAVVTPRAMSSLFTGQELLAFTQRSHRGTSTLVYRWGGTGDDRKMWKSSCPSDLRSDTNIKLVGSEAAGVVVTSHGDTLQLRDINTGIKTRDIRLDTAVDVMWADDYNIVTLNRNMDCGAPITVLKMT